MYKKFFFFLLNLLLLSFPLVSQENKRVNEKPEDKVSYELKLEQNNCSAFIVANIKVIENWHINAANLPPESYSVPTQINLDTSYLYTTDDSIFEPEFEHVYDSLAKEDLYLHDGNIVIKKRVTLLENISDTIRENLFIKLAMKSIAYQYFLNVLNLFLPLVIMKKIK